MNDSKKTLAAAMSLLALGHQYGVDHGLVNPLASIIKPNKYPKGWGAKKRQALDEAMESGMTYTEAVEHVGLYKERNE